MRDQEHHEKTKSMCVKKSKMNLTLENYIQSIGPQTPGKYLQPIVP